MDLEALLDVTAIELKRYGLADRDDLATLLPGALTRFQVSYTWDNLIPDPVTFNTVANRDYVSGPNDLFKVLGIWKTGFTVGRMARKEWTRHKAGGLTSSERGIKYWQKGKRIYLSPQPTGVEEYNLLYYPEIVNLQLEQIPSAYHFAVIKILEEMWVPKSAKEGEVYVYNILRNERREAIKECIGIEMQQPDDTTKTEMNIQQRVLNIRKNSGRGTKRFKSVFG